MTGILALQGGSRGDIQAALAAFAERRRSEGLRVAGCIETMERGDGGDERYVLQDLLTGRIYEVEQDLGRFAEACNLNPAGIVDACQNITAALTDDCDVVVLAKFGKLEVQRSGLMTAFAQAAERGIPILTSVAPAFGPAWAQFAGDLATIVPPNRDTLDAWWHAHELRHSISDRENARRRKLIAG